MKSDGFDEENETLIIFEAFSTLLITKKSEATLLIVLSHTVSKSSFKVKLDNGTYRGDAQTMTVRDLGGYFLDNCEARFNAKRKMKRRTFQVYRGHVNKHILNPDLGIGGIKLAQLTQGRIHEFSEALILSGVSVVTTRKVISTIHTMLQYAIKNDWLAVNVAHGLEIVGVDEEDDAKLIQPPSKEDFKTLVDAADDDLKLKVVFAGFTGLRASEQWGLQWKHIDLDNGEVNVERAVVGNDVQTTKSKKGKRTVPLSGALVRMLKAHKLKSEWVGNEDFLFTNKFGRKVDHDNFRKRQYNPLLERAGVSDVNWHALRHFAVSTWIEQGLQPKTIQTYAGHSTLDVTMNRYGHLFPSEDHKSAMDSIAGELLG